MRRRSVGGSGIEFTVLLLCRHILSSEVQKGGACSARAAAMLAHTVSLGVGMLRGLLERAKLLFIRHRGLDVGERHCLSVTCASRAKTKTTQGFCVDTMKAGPGSRA
eukprot:scaffold4328_cov135-Isochrysis_galbana.AAC.11